MTEDQKAISLVLELLHSSRGIPRTYQWLENEVKFAGRRCELPTILAAMTDDHLIAADKDALRIIRYTLTPAGREALDNL